MAERAATATTLKAPFTYFGGKAMVADRVWEFLGDVQYYVEPFFGSGAVLLARPHVPKMETVNDKCGFVANFWRAVKYAPEEVAEYADWPVNENDLHARHIWLVGWTVVPWRAGRGYSLGDMANRHRERLWVSPQCMTCLLGEVVDG